MNRVFVTGARGFVGSRLVESLLDKGYAVHALVRKGTNLSKQLANHPNIKVFEGDLTDIASLHTAVKSCSQAYHLAALAKPWDKDMNVFHKVNVEGTMNFLEACLSHSVRDIVITSSAGMFGPQQGVQPVNEDTLPKSWFSEYERTKWDSVQKAKAFISKGLNIRFVSPTRVFGPGELSTSNAVTKLIGDYIDGKFRFVPGDGHGIGNYAFVDDVVQGHIVAMNKGKTGENYILGGENASYRYFFDQVGEVNGKKYNLLNMPIFIMLFASSIMESWANISGRPPLITPPFVRKYTHNWGTDLTKAKNELGYRITPLSDAIKQCVDWLTAQQRQR